MGQERFSGVLEVTVTARTPLLIGGFPAPGVLPSPEIKELPKRRDGTVMIPGSGLMGAVRSLHEALVGGCMRIVDTEWVPVHRHPATTAETQDLRLAVVWDVDDEGRAKSMRLCDDWGRIPKELLPGSGATDEELPATGDQLLYEPGKRLQGDALRPRSEEHPDWTGSEEITRLQQIGQVKRDCWVLLVTDTNARPVPKEDKDKSHSKRSPVHYWAGRLSPDSPRCQITEGAWEAYKQTVAGANDLRRASLIKAGVVDGEEPAWDPERSPDYADVWWPPQPDSERRLGSGNGRAPEPRRKIGRRLQARSYLHVGQPVWVKVANGSVTEIRLSLLWRYLGDKTVGERLGAAKPCTDPDKLCWSCRMFGSADTAGREETDLAVQNSYRGHVRIDDLLAVGDVKPITWQLAPLASPRPSAGQFYLDNSAVAGNSRIAARDTRPSATWGSVADEASTRLVRGRKYYWRTKTQADPSGTEPVRSRHRGHQSDTMSSAVSLIPAGTVFTGRVAFDNLDAAEYGSLLAALDPRLLDSAGEDGWEKAVTSVGGGKPFGFGSVTIDVKPVKAETPGQRYLGSDGPAAPDGVTAVAQFRGSVPEAARAGWTALRNALEFGFIDDAKVWYPPGGGERGSEDYDKSFEFFAHTTGLRLSDGYRDLVVLPDASLPADRQELDSAAGEHREQRQRQGAADQTGPSRQGRGRPGRPTRPEPGHER
jgi:CRISPR-associated protein (TIGR03986 family)